MNFDIKKYWPFIAGAFAIVIVGVVSAWLISSNMMKGSLSGANAAPGAKVTSTSAGVLDPTIKYATATGVLSEGGIGNEGTHHLTRDGGPSQTVYLTSSVVDLSIFDGKKVEVWGETQSSKKAGWLMDVSKVQIVQ